MTMKSYTIGGHLRLLRSALALRSIAGKSCATMIALGIKRCDGYLPVEVNIFTRML